MQDLGFPSEAFDSGAPEIWPCCAQAVAVFSTLGTQWRMAPMGGLVGLDYAALPTVFRLSGVPRSEWPELFQDVRTLERGALEAVQ